MQTLSKDATIQHYIAKFDMASFLNENLLDALEIFHFPVYSNVYVEEQKQQVLYFLVEGQVHCNHYHLNGDLAVFAISSPFTVIGDLEIFSETSVHSNVIAIQNTSLLGIKRSTVHRYGADDPKFLHYLIKQAHQKLYASNTHQKNHALPVNKRLALFLLEHRTENNIITLPDKEILASLLSTTLRHLNRVLKNLVSSGAISDSYPRIHILDTALLTELSN